MVRRRGQVPETMRVSPSESGPAGVECGTVCVMLRQKRTWIRAVISVAIVVVGYAYAIRAARWSRGLDSEFIVYGRTFEIVAQTIVPQIAMGSFDGGNTIYITYISVTNSGPAEADFRADFYSDDRKPLTFRTSRDSLPSFTGNLSTIRLKVGETFSIASDSVEPRLAWGWLFAHGQRGNLSTSFTFGSAFEVRDLRTGAVYYSAIVPTSAGFGHQNGVIPRVANVPGNTEVAFSLVNLDSQLSATITGTLLDANGKTLASRTILLPPTGHTAVFAREFFQLNSAPPATETSVAFSSNLRSIAGVALAYAGDKPIPIPIELK